jgi:hypothetical protein
VKKKDGLLEDLDEESRGVPLALIAAVLGLELAAFACALAIRFNSF